MLVHQENRPMLHYTVVVDSFGILKIFDRGQLGSYKVIFISFLFFYAQVVYHCPNFSLISELESYPHFGPFIYYLRISYVVISGEQSLFLPRAICSWK